MSSRPKNNRNVSLIFEEEKDMKPTNARTAVETNGRLYIDTFHVLSFPCYFKPRSLDLAHQGHAPAARPEKRKESISALQGTVSLVIAMTTSTPPRNLLIVAF